MNSPTPTTMTTAIPDLTISQQKACSARVGYEFQYLNHGGTWQAGIFEQNERIAKKHFKMMTKRFPRQGYRLICRTVVDKVISQNKPNLDTAPQSP